MLKKSKILTILSFISIILLGFNYIVNADMGPKPSITIHLKNLETDNYIIDLFVDYDYSSNMSGMNFNSIAEVRRNNS